MLFFVSYNYLHFENGYHIFQPGQIDIELQDQTAVFSFPHHLTEMVNLTINSKVIEKTKTPPHFSISNSKFSIIFPYHFSIFFTLFSSCSTTNFIFRDSAMFNIYTDALNQNICLFSPFYSTTRIANSQTAISSDSEEIPTQKIENPFYLKRDLNETLVVTIQTVEKFEPYCMLEPIMYWCDTKFQIPSWPSNELKITCSNDAEKKVSIIWLITISMLIMFAALIVFIFPPCSSSSKEEQITDVLTQSKDFDEISISSDEDEE